MEYDTQAFEALKMRNLLHQLYDELKMEIGKLDERIERIERILKLIGREFPSDTFGSYDVEDEE